MRIWHERLIPKLCRQHLLAVWREGLGCYSILYNDKKGYRKHPAVKEFENAIMSLYQRLEVIRNEMLRRGYKPKALPPWPQTYRFWFLDKPWQTYKEQVKVLKAKKCKCDI